MTYGTIAAFRTYHLDRGRDHSLKTDDQIAPALLVASEWIDATFRNGFNGSRTGGKNQVREWPRTGAVDTYGDGVASAIVPVQIENATYEVAAKLIENPGAVNVDFTPSKYKRASVDGAVSAEFVLYTTASETQTQFPVVFQILSTLLQGSGQTSIFSSQSSRV